jgi:uncharacterized protein (DUF362 family)
MKKIMAFLEKTANKKISRRNFLKILAGFTALLAADNRLLRFAFAGQDSSNGRPKKGIKGIYDLVEAEGPDPYKNTVEAVKALGGMRKFVKTGDTVVIKPNISWDRVPEQAATTNPSVVAALTEMCYEAGAKRVNIFDNTCNAKERCYENSGIRKAAEEKGAYVYYPDGWNTVKARFKYKSPMDGWPVFRDAVMCDCFISAPVLKHHRLTELTLSMKNLMGICSGVRGIIHTDIDRKLVDLTDFISPELTVIDATRVLLRNGPSGGSLKDVKVMNRVLVATDPSLIDSYAAVLIGKNPMDIPYIREAARRGFGRTDTGSASVHKIKT